MPQEFVSVLVRERVYECGCMIVDVSAYLYPYVMYVLMAVVALFTCDQVVERNPRNAGAL